jgi:hypothetical protein
MWRADQYIFFFVLEAEQRTEDGDRLRRKEEGKYVHIVGLNLWSPLTM